MTDETTVGHWTVDDCDVYIGRGNQDFSNQMTLLTAFQNSDYDEYGAFGNPFVLDEYDRNQSVRLYRAVLEVLIDLDDDLEEAVADLHGQTLGCWCQSVSEDGPACHGDVLAQKADELAGDDDE